MRLLFYFVTLLALLVMGCVRQANTTQPKDDGASIDSALAVTVDSHEDTVLTDSAESTAILTDSASTNLQSLEVYSDRELPSMSFDKDTVETVLSAGYAKTFLSKDKEEILKYIIKEDTMLYTGIKANVIISNHDRADTIIITRSLLAKQLPFLDESDIDIEEFEVAHIDYLYEKSDTVCFLIALIKPDTDFDFYFKYYHTNENEYIEQDFDQWAKGEEGETIE